MKRSREFLALALLVPTLITAACGSGGEQAETAETGAETTEADASETIGAGADVNTELDAPEAKVSVPLSEALVITATKIETEMGRNRVYVDIENTTGEDVYIEWLDLAIDGQTISKDSGSGSPSWFPDLWSPKIKAGETRQEKFFIDHLDKPYVEYAETSIDATILNSDKTQTEPLKVTISLKDVETVDMNIDASKEIYVEEQELYNDDGVIITVTGIEDGRSGYATELRFQSSGSKIANFDELYIGDTLMYSITQELRTDGIEVIFENGESEEPSQVFVYIMDEDVQELIREELPEISVVYRIYDGKGSNVQTPKLTFPILSK